MNCHKNNKKNHGDHNHSPLKHVLHMALCCGLPIVIVGLLPIIAKFSPGAGNVLGKITPFLCPIMMISMLPMMLGGNKKGSCCDNSNENHDNRPLEVNKPAEVTANNTDK